MASEPDVWHFSEMLTDHGMTQLVMDVAHNKASSPPGCSYCLKPQCNSISTRLRMYDPCLCDTHGNLSGDHMAIKFCVNARMPARVCKEIVFR